MPTTAAAFPALASNATVAALTPTAAATLAVIYVHLYSQFVDTKVSTYELQRMQSDLPLIYLLHNLTFSKKVIFFSSVYHHLSHLPFAQMAY